jgi:hypothetical protein
VSSGNTSPNSPSGTTENVSAEKLKSRHGYRVAPSTRASWMREHRELTTYSRLRPSSTGAH